MLASRLSGLLPPLNNHEALESAAIFSLVSSTSLQKQWRRRPFRSPHHSASLTAMVGGGSIPGRVRSHWPTMAFCFLMNCLSLSVACWMHCENPLSQVRYISRTRAKISYPAQFQLIAAMNPSPTGHYQGNHNRCTPEQTLRYLGKLIRPIPRPLRFIPGNPLPPPGLLSQTGITGESSAEVRERVIAAQARQYARQNKLNAHLDNAGIRQFCSLNSEDADGWRRR
jgi:magnesium chelatase family protein